MSFKTTAEQILQENNYKLTTQRKQVIDILAKNKKPLNPYDIAKKSNDTINVATVYRTMQLFEQLGLVHKIRSIDGYIACTQNHDHHCHHYAVCTDCHNVQEIQHHYHTHPLPENFHSDNQVFELTGKCKKCK